MSGLGFGRPGLVINLKSKVVSYSITSVGHSADPGFLAVIPLSLSRQPGDRLPLLSTRPAVTFAAKEINPLADTKLYWLVTEAHRCK